MKTWSLQYEIITRDLASKVNNRTHIFRSIKFQARNSKEAKMKILDFSKKVLKRVKNMKNRMFCVMAMPYLIYNDNEHLLDGNKMIRLKWKYSNKKLLRIKNPDIAFVQGYGPEALQQIEGRQK